MTKRVLDLVLSAVALAILVPVFLFVAILIKLDSKGDIIFKQLRVGKNGRLFEIYKFRTMLQSKCDKGVLVTTTRDERITGVGKTLRKYKLDELPQFFNVLKGDMSIIGPRPEVPKYVEYYPDKSRRTILSVRPGISDNVSIMYKDENDILANEENPEHAYINKILPTKIRLYEEYVNDQGSLKDLKIMIQTVIAILKK